MEVILEKMNSQVYAIRPQVEKVQGQNYMKINYEGCTHILLLCRALDNKIDFLDEEVRMQLQQLEEKVLSGEEVPMSGNGIKARTVSYVAMRQNRDVIALPDLAANYAVCGCRYDRQKDQFRLYLPESASSQYQTVVSIEVSYHVEPYTVPVKKGFLGLGGTEYCRTDFYKAIIATERSHFCSGDIVYTVSGSNYKYPVTDKMKGKEILIRSMGDAPPRFFSEVSGVTLSRI